MSSNILITGAAGYIGGSLLANLLASNNAVIKKAHISAAVRSSEQAEALSKLGINVLQLDIANEEAVVESLLRHEINIVVHCASSLDPNLALPLISALGKRREASGDETYFIHTSADSAFHESSGWTHGEIKDTGSVFELEKQVADSYPVRKTDVTVVEHAKTQGVTSFTVVPTMVYGRGSGLWNKLSVLLPVYIEASISKKQVFKFPHNKKVAAVHITDFTVLYERIIEKILKHETLSSGEEGYYFAQAHDVYWWELLDRLAVALHARGLVKESKAEIWPSDEAAAENLGIPVQFVQILWNSNANAISENKYKLGWEPAWNKDRLLQNIDDEIKAVLELKRASSLLDSLHQAKKG